MDAAQPDSPVSTRFLMKFILLSIAAAVLTVGIKGSAALIPNGMQISARQSTIDQSFFMVPLPFLYLYFGSLML